MLKKAILIVTAATFAPTGSFAQHDAPAVPNSPFVSYACFDPNALYKDVVDNTPFRSQYFEIAEWGENNFTIVAGSAEADTPLDGGEGPINGTRSQLMFVNEVGDYLCD